MNAGWTHMKWDEASLRLECQKLGEPYLRKFDSFDQMILKIDYGRYVVLYNYGGVSVDTDMVPLKSLSHVPEFHTSEFIVSKPPFPAEYFGISFNNAVFCVRKGHPILKELIDTITRSTKTKEDYLVKELQTHMETGPLLVSGILKTHIAEIVVLSNEYFEPCTPSDMYCKVPSTTILDHRHTNTWVSSPIQFLQMIFFFVLHNLRLILTIGLLSLYLFAIPSGIRLRRSIFGTRTR